MAFQCPGFFPGFRTTTPLSQENLSGENQPIHQGLHPWHAHKSITIAFVIRKLFRLCDLVFLPGRRLKPVSPGYTSTFHLVYISYGYSSATNSRVNTCFLKDILAAGSDLAFSVRTLSKDK
jgi:hypothetical protein